MLIVGRVTGLREHLRWFDARPLFGKRIVVTRPREQAGELVEQLEALGATVIEAPTIRIAPPEDFGPLDAAVASAGTFDWIVFTSVNGVDYFMQRLPLGPGDIRDLKGVRICAHRARDGRPAAAARDQGRSDAARSTGAEAVLDAIREAGSLDGKRVLLPRADVAREPLADHLRKSGAEVTEVTAYRSVPVEIDDPNEPDIYRMLLDKQIDVVTFTSPSTVRHFLRLYGKDQAADLLASTIVASIGPVTAEAAEQGGVHTTVLPAEYTIAGLVRAIVEHFEHLPAGPASGRRPAPQAREGA